MIDVYLDVDGVLLPCFDPAEGVNEERSGFTDWRPPARTIRAAHAYSPEMTARLAALAALDNVTFHWCTTWRSRAREELAPAIGLPTDWDVLDEDWAYDRAESANRTIRSWWKRDAVQAHHAERPSHNLVWIDDDLAFDDDACDWIRSLDGAALGFSPVTEWGLTRAAVEVIEDFASTGR